MKKIACLAASLLFLALVISCSKKAEPRQFLNDKSTPVERYGALQVVGTSLCDQNGNPIQLCGMSSHGLHWHGKFANKNVIKWLRDDWNCDLWRAAMYAGESGGYVNNPAIANKVIESI